MSGEVVGGWGEEEHSTSRTRPEAREGLRAQESLEVENVAWRGEVLIPTLPLFILQVNQSGAQKWPLMIHAVDHAQCTDSSVVGF
jgi:hypothetical protein